MFVFRQVESFKWPVRIHVPVDGGRKEVREIEAEFRVLSPEQVAAHVAAARGGDESSDLAILRDVLIGWSGVGGEGGDEIPYSDVWRDKILAVPYVRRAVITAYFDAVSGEARKGN